MSSVRYGRKRLASYCVSEVLAKVRAKGKNARTQDSTVVEHLVLGTNKSPTAAVAVEVARHDHGKWNTICDLPS